MASLKGTQTEKNILTAFAGESQARNRYSYFASKAMKEGYRHIQEIFLETAENEKEHAKRLFKFLEGGEAEITASFPAGVIGTTLENLEEAANGEKHEYEHMYPEFADIADEEGFTEVASAMRAIAVAEMRHEARYRTLIEHIKNGTMFKRDKPILWKCGNCGYIFEGEGAPPVCPACKHEQAHFYPADENW